MRKHLLPLKRTKLKHNQGDIFALQLRGHIALLKQKKQRDAGTATHTEKILMEG